MNTTRTTTQAYEQDNRVAWNAYVQRQRKSWEDNLRTLREIAIARKERQS